MHHGELHLHGAARVCLHHHVLAPVVEEVLKVPDAPDRGPVVGGGDGLEGASKGLGKGEQLALLKVAQGQLEETLKEEKKSITVVQVWLKIIIFTMPTYALQ